MKIAFVSQPWNNLRPPVQSGSIAILTYQIAQRLAKDDTPIIYAKKSNSQQKMLHDKGVEYRWIDTTFDRGWHKLIKRFHWDNPKHPLVSSSLYHIGYILQIALDLRKIGCDVVHIFTFSQFAPIIRRFNPKIKIVLNMGCEWLTQFEPAIIEKRLRSVDLILGCSQYITSRVQASFPQLAARCQTLYNAVDVHQFTRPDSRPNSQPSQKGPAKRLTFVGRVSPEKGVHVLLEAFPKVVACYPQAQLRIIGPVKPVRIEFTVGLSKDPKVLDLARFYQGSYQSYLQHRIVPAADDGVVFDGLLPHSQLVGHYQDSDVFIFPSVWEEPFGIPVIEAMAVGIPVVATQGGAFPEIVQAGKTGLLVERGNAAALAAAILHILADTDLQQTMGQAARQRAVEHFSYEVMTETLLKYYRNLCETE